MIKQELTCGVYLILHKPTNQSYVGSSKNIHHRFAQHMMSKESKWGITDCETTFELFLLEKCAQKELKVRESFWLEKLKPELNKHLFSGPPIHKGATNSRSIGTQEQYEQVIKLGAKNEHYSTIAGEVGLTEGVVKSILNGQSHKYLQDKFPKEWREILFIKRKLIRLSNKEKGNFEFICKGVRQVEEYLEVTNLGRVVSGDRSICKGWTLPSENFDEDFEVVNLLS